MTQIGYVLGIRKVVATKHAPEIETKRMYIFVNLVSDNRNSSTNVNDDL